MSVWLAAIENKGEKGDKMKKKAVIILAAAAAAAMLTACSGEISNDYVTVKQYKNLEVPQVVTDEVDDTQVDQIVNNVLESTAEQEEITGRAAEMGDWVNIDFTGYVDGEAFDGGSGTGTDLELGSNSFIGANGDYKGFEEQIAGHTTGDEFDITVQFPDSYQNQDMAGVVADFHIVLNSIFQKNIPELTDEWVQANSDTSETVDEFREEIRTSLEDSNEESARSSLLSEVQSALLEQSEIKEYPEGAVDEQVSQATDYYTWIAGLYGIELSDYVETYLQTTMDDFNTQLENAAKQTVQLDEALKLIAEREDISLTEEEYQDKFSEYAESAGADDVDAYVEQNGEDVLRDAALRDRVLDYLVDNCIQVEASE